MNNALGNAPENVKPAGLFATDRLVELLLKLNKRLLWVGVGLVLIGSTIFSISLTAGLVATTDKPWTSRLGTSTLSFFASFLVNLAAAAVVYLVSVALFIPQLRKMESQKTAKDFVVHPLYELLAAKIDESKAGDVTEYKNKWDVKWDIEIEAATKTIDICVQGWDGLVKHHQKDWEKFFEIKHGHVNLILPKIGEDTMIHMQRRLGRQEQRQVEEIENTYTMLEKIRISKKCQGRGEIKVWSYRPMIWYCLVRIDNRVAFLSCYEHVDGGTIESPFLRIRLDKFPMLRDWIDKEIKGMTEAVPDLTT